MYYQVEQVLEKYEPDVTEFYKGRGILICETKQGLFALKEYNGSAEKAEHLFWLGDQLWEHGIVCDRMIRNREGELLTRGIDGSVYTMHHWVRGRECEVRSRMDVRAAVTAIATFHQVCSLKEYPQLSELFSRKRPSREEYVRHERELNRVKKFILKRKNKSEFELLYLNCFPEFYEQSRYVTMALAEEKNNPESAGLCGYGICHGDMNQHNLLFAAGKPALIHMEHACLGRQVTDLGNFMRKILEKYDWEEWIGMTMLEAYENVRPLGQQERTELYYRLAYPEKFWKIANHYYNSRKVWDSGISREKLSREIQRSERKNLFLHRLEKEVLQV